MLAERVALCSSRCRAGRPTGDVHDLVKDMNRFPSTASSFASDISLLQQQHVCRHFSGSSSAAISLAQAQMSAVVSMDLQCLLRHYGLPRDTIDSRRHSTASRRTPAATHPSTRNDMCSHGFSPHARRDPPRRNCTCTHKARRCNPKQGNTKQGNRKQGNAKQINAKQS